MSVLPNGRAFSYSQKGVAMPTSYLKQFAERRQKKKIQFPPEVTGPVTIWPMYTDLLTGNQINIRCVLQNSFWNDDSISVFQNTGQQTRYSVTLYIPYNAEVTGRTYVTPDEWNNLAVLELDSHWTINPRQLPLMVKGVNEHEFQWADPNAANRIIMQENALLNANPSVRRAVDVNNNFFGSANMWHVVVRV